MMKLGREILGFAPVNRDCRNGHYRCSGHSAVDVVTSITALPSGVRWLQSYCM